MRKRIYILSEDLQHLLEHWVKDQFKHDLDLDFTPIRNRLHRILSFGNHQVMSIAYRDLHGGIHRLLAEDHRPIVSTDPVYANKRLMVNVTRTCNHTREKQPGLHPRHGNDPLDRQFHRIAEHLGASHDHIVDITLVDDVIFSSNTLCELYDHALKAHLHIVRAVCGILIGTSDRTELKQRNIHIDAAYAFSGEHPEPEVVDEICERDFFVFAPMTGRTLADATQNAGFPYIEPFGDAHNWASIDPGKVHEVSRALIELNVDLLKQIEEQLGHAIEFRHLYRKPMGVQHPDVVSSRIADHLIHHLKFVP